MIYIYIYIEREIERERERDSPTDRLQRRPSGWSATTGAAARGGRPRQPRDGWKLLLELFHLNIYNYTYMYVYIYIYIYIHIHIIVYYPLGIPERDSPPMNLFPSKLARLRFCVQRDWVSTMSLTERFIAFTVREETSTASGQPSSCNLRYGLHVY